MSLEYAIEKYPCAARLKDGTVGMVRVFKPEDESAFHQFFLSIPEHERLFIKERVTAPEEFHKWFREMELERNIPIVLLMDNTLVGIAMLHLRQGGWKRNIGLLSSLTHPEFRGRGVAKALAAEHIHIGRHLGLRKLEAEFNGERTETIKDMCMLGFEELTHLPDYLQDMQARCHDYVLMGIDLVTDEEYTGSGD